MARFTTAALRNAVISAPATTCVPTRFAAEELQRYLQRMSNLHLPIVEDASLNGRHAIVVGTAAATKDWARENDDSRTFTIIPEPQRVILQGNSPRTLLDAVYNLLEQLGCRWSLHGIEEETVPDLATDIDVKPMQHAAPFAVRGYSTDVMTWHYTQPEHFNSRLAEDRAFIDWMGKSGANTFFFIRHPFDTQSTIAELLPDFERRGIGVEYGGHIIPLLLPRTLYRDHPDYFPAAPDGARIDHGNLCTSNAAALNTVKDNAIKYVQEFPEMNALHVWGADLWHGGWCRCADCGPVSVQDQSLRVCNAAARGLAEAGSGSPVCYLAYHDTIRANLTLRPDDNVMVEFAPRERCYGHALGEPQCTTNATYAAALQRYIDLFQGRVRLFEYYGDAILFFGCALPLTEVIAADLEYYQRLGIDGVTMLQFGTYSLAAYPLNFFAFARATSGLSSVASVCDAYCTRFGQHAAAVAAVYVELEAIMQSVATYGDIRRPPRLPSAVRTLRAVEAALPRLLSIAQHLDAQRSPTLTVQAAWVRYTHAVLEGVRQHLRANCEDTVPTNDAHYQHALEIMEAVDRRFKGLWGTVDLPIIHHFYNLSDQ